MRNYLHSRNNFIACLTARELHHAEDAGTSHINTFFIRTGRAYDAVVIPANGIVKEIVFCFIHKSTGICLAPYSDTRPDVSRYSRANIYNANPLRSTTRYGVTCEGNTSPVSYGRAYRTAVPV